MLSWRFPLANIERLVFLMHKSSVDTRHSMLKFRVHGQHLRASIVNRTKKPDIPKTLAVYMLLFNHYPTGPSRL